MTQKEKLIRARLMAVTIRSIASRLEEDARDYDVQFPHSYVKELKELSNEFLKLK